MTEKTLTDARAHLAEAIDAARRDHDPVYITRHGRRIAALIDSDDLHRLIEAAEDLADLRGRSGWPVLYLFRGSRSRPILASNEVRRKA